MTSETARRDLLAKGWSGFLHVGMVIAAAVFLFPFFWMVSNALRVDREIFAVPPILLPSEIQWHNFAQAWRYLPFGRFFLNSASVALAVTAIVLVVSSLAGY